MSRLRGTLQIGQWAPVVFPVAVLALIPMCPADAWASRAYLSSQPIWSTVDGDTTRCAVFGDVDRDGDLDLVCGNDGCANMLYFNEAGVFNEQPDWSSPDSSRTFAVALADLDNDGDLDLVCGNFGEQNVIYWNENPGFVRDTLWTPERVDETTSIIVGDVNIDGYVDIVFGNTNAPTALYLNNGGEIANEPAWESPVAATMDVALGDVDGDGNLDLVCGNDGGKNTLYLYEGGTSIFTQNWESNAEYRTFGVALGDVDGDGDFDLVCANANKPNTLYKNTGDTLGQSPSWTSNDVSLTTSVVLGDIDGDGDLDAVFGNKGQVNTLHVNELSEGNQFVFSSSVYVWGAGPANGTFDIVPGDLDGDGDLDVLCANGSGDDRRNTLYENFSILVDPVPVWESSLQNSSFGVALGDVDNDGDLDVAFGNGQFFDQRNTIYRNDYRDAGNWQIDNLKVFWDKEEANWIEPDQTDSKTIGVALADLDGGGVLDDLVAGNAGAPNSVHWNVQWTDEGEPGSEWRWQSGDSEATVTVVVGDLDGDGDLDLVFGNGGTLNRPNSLYLNDGTDFSDVVMWEDSSTYWSATIGVALGDVDGDGDLDLVCGNNNSQANTLSLNVGGTRIFTAEPVWKSGFKRDTFGVALGDLDGDGDLDLVCGNAGTTDQANTVYVNIGGTFSSEPDWESELADRSTFGVALGDIDGDGDLDLACGNGGTAAEKNTLYLNIGSPDIFTATPAWEADTADWTFGVAMGDVDDDGDADLVFANSGVSGGSNVLYLGRKDPVFKGIAPCKDNPLSPCVVNATPNNPAYLVQVRVTPAGGDEVAVSFVALDVESDPVWIVPEYQYEGDPRWLRIPDSDIRGSIDSLQTSLDGVKHSFKWDVHLLAFDKRPVVLRLRTVEVPRHVSVMRHIASYIKPIGPIEPVRPEIAIAPDSVVFPPVAVCGRTTADFIIRNTGTAVLTVKSIGFPSEDMWTDTDPPFNLAPGSVITIPIHFEPESPGDVAGDIEIDCDDPNNENPVVRVAARVMELLSFRDPPDETVPNNTPVRIDVSLPPGGIFAGGEILVRRGGESDWSYRDSLVTAGGPSPRAVVPEEYVGSRGVEYKVVLDVAIDTTTLTLTDPPCETFVSLPVRVGGLRFPYRLPNERYRMISIPLDLESGSILGAFDELGDHGPKTWRLWGYYDPKTENYYQELPAYKQKFEQGRAYWLVTRSEGIRLNTAPDVGLTAPTEIPFEKTLQSGWNMIGDPFNFNVAWDAIQVQIGDNTLAMTDSVTREVIGGLWRYEYEDKTPSSIVDNYFSYVRAEVLVPFEGYFVKNLLDTSIVLHIPPIEMLHDTARSSPPASVAREKKSVVDEWTIRIAASSAGLKDPCNYIGVKRGARSGWDPEDQAEPPSPPGGSLFLYFPHYDWISHPDCYATDIRGGYEAIDPAVPGAAWIGEDAVGQAFCFDVAMSLPSEASGDKIVIEFAGVDGVPAEARVILADRRLNRVVDLRRGNRYGFYQPNRGTVREEKEARFVVLVGSKEFVETETKKVQKIPARTVLRPNFPNPFNPITIVRYELAKQGRVTLRIYDVNGKLVRVLVDRHREAGYYEVGWNATNERGEPVATGVYFCRFEGAGVRQTRKMVFLK